VRVVSAAAADRAAPAEASMLMNIMPILCRRRSAGISHNIAQERQEQRVIGDQNNTFPPAWRPPESAERRSYTMSGATLAHDDSRMQSACLG
jgi:hypothetical protein